jgi:hypothetical protein
VRKKKGILGSGGELEFACICSGELAFMIWELFVSSEHAFCFAHLPMVSSPFCLTLRSRCCEHFGSVVLSRCPCLRGPRLSLSSDLVLAFVRLLITCLSSLFIFSSSLFYELVTMCVVNAFIKGEIEDLSIRGPVDGRSMV